MKWRTLQRRSVWFVAITEEVWQLKCWHAEYKNSYPNASLTQE